MKKAVIITLLLAFFALVAIANINRKTENKTEQEMEQKVERNASNPVCFRKLGISPTFNEAGLFVYSPFPLKNNKINFKIVEQIIKKFVLLTLLTKTRFMKHQPGNFICYF